MAKYVVTLEERSVYFVEVDAADPDAAMKLAEKTFINAPDIRVFGCDVMERVPVNVQKVEP